MTVCIAAVCDSGTDAKIVLCSDRRMTSHVGVTDNNFKIHPTVAGWVFMGAGTDLEIGAVHRLVADEMRAVRKAGRQLDETNIEQAARNALRRRKDEVASEYIAARFGMTLEHLLKVGRSDFPPDVFRDAMIGVERLELQSQFILAGFAGGLIPICLRTQINGHVGIFDNFTAIGSGEGLAYGALMRRDQNEMDSLAATIYKVFEAKRYAEGEVGVGPGTSIVVAHGDGRRQLVAEGARDALAATFKRFGPQEITDVPSPESEGFFQELAQEGGVSPPSQTENQTHQQPVPERHE